MTRREKGDRSTAAGAAASYNREDVDNNTSTLETTTTRHQNALLDSEDDDDDNTNDPNAEEEDPNHHHPTNRDGILESSSDDEIQELVGTMRPDQSMSIATTSDYNEGDFSDYDDQLSPSQRGQYGWGRQHHHHRNHSQDNNNSYEYDYLDEEEGVFVMGGGGRHDGGGHSPRHSCFFMVPNTKVRILIAFFIVFFIAAIFYPKQKETEENPTVRKYKGAPQYVCPSPKTASSSITPGHVFYHNDSTIMDLINTNFTYYVKHFRELEYRDYGITYKKMKKGMTHWKTNRFLPNLKTGDSIFESNSGLGLDLLLTMEILNQVHDNNNKIRDLHLYGTDFGTVSAEVSNVFLDSVLTTSDLSIGGGKRGVICTADSTHLNFISDNSFDLVYTSFLDPVPDPWFDDVPSDKTKDGRTSSVDERQRRKRKQQRRRREICNLKDTDWKAQALYDMVQGLQYDWYTRWVSELVRIVKPGAPVILEHVPFEYCETKEDTNNSSTSDTSSWGGVPYSFWLNHSHWQDVDPDSIEFEPDTVLDKQYRYHVFMRKQKRA